ncbi:MAG TPA: tripartite tricarboxylate transporter substrate binding protein [Afifellaceae bacterium]|nr:tripartite tricarboxylate transporter substrate binding protein [Afifellaceae bacterium]
MGKQFVTSAAFGALLAGVLAAFPAAAQDKVPYPVDTVTLVTHSSPGGGTDVYLREMVKHLSEYIDANFVVENVRGGSGANAMAHIANGPADGSIFYGTTPTFINTSLLSQPQYTYEDMKGVVNIFLDPQIVYVRAESPYQTLAEIVEKAKAEPGSVKYGVTTPGSLDRQVMEKFKAITGAEGPVITHDGGGDLLINVLNGTLDMGIGEIQELRSQLEAGQVRLIATYTEERLDDFPDVPTAREQGIDLVVDKFRGLAGHPDLPDEVLRAWEETIPRVLEDPEFREWYRASSLIPEFMPSEEYDQFLKDFAEEQKAFFVEYNITEE